MRPDWIEAVDSIDWDEWDIVDILEALEIDPTVTPRELEVAVIVAKARADGEPTYRHSDRRLGVVIKTARLICEGIGIPPWRTSRVGKGDEWIFEGPV